MNTDIDRANINVLDQPIKTDFGQWIIDHPDCDTIFDKAETSSVIIIYAYATSKKGNSDLHLYRDTHFTGKKILKGVSLDGIRKLV